MNISYRPDSTPCYIPLYDQVVGCDCPQEQGPCFTSSLPETDLRNLPAAKADCAPGSSRPANQLLNMQGRVKATGSVVVDRLAFKYTPRARDESVDCRAPSCKPATCCPYEEEFAYQLAPVGTNSVVPDVPPPDGIPQTFEATASAIATCPDGSQATAEATATSTISYADALAKAKLAAQEAAEAKLDCGGQPCTAFNDGFKFVAAGDPYDLNFWFQPGQYPSNEGEPWRLIDTDLNVYANGIVFSGTLGVMFADTTPPITFDEVTKILENLSVDGIYVGIQVACHGEFAELPDPSECVPYVHQAEFITQGGGSAHFTIFDAPVLGYENRPFRIYDVTDSVVLLAGTIDGTGNLVYSGGVGPGDFDCYIVPPDVFNDFVDFARFVQAQIACVVGEESVWPT
jgi:hypothetical protein